MDGEREVVRASVDGDKVKNSPYLDSDLNLSAGHAAGVHDLYEF
jgi:hypothetical protein